MSITVPPPSPPGEDPGPDDGGRVAAWFAASRRRLGVSEDEWYSPAVEHLLAALADDEPLAPAVAELGNARGTAGFDLRETVTDLEALIEVLPEPEAGRLNELSTTAALTTWADAFIDKVHPPACVDNLTGLATTGFLRARLEEVYRECAAADREPADAYALVVGRVRPRSTYPFVRLTARIQVARHTRAHFPGGETAVFDEPDRLLVLAPVDERLAPRVEALGAALDAERSLAEHPGGPRCRVERLPRELDRAMAMIDRALARSS